MTLVRRLAFAALLLSSLILMARRAESYERLVIDEHPVVFMTEVRYYSDLEEDLVRSLELSLSKWNAAVDGCLTWTRVEDPLDANLIFTYGKMQDSFLALASCLDGRFDGPLFRIDRAMVQINPATLVSVELMDSVVLHELGHVFGLGHPTLTDFSDKPTMSVFQAGNSEELNTLHSDDIDGIREIFGLSPVEPAPLKIDRRKNIFTVAGTDSSVYWKVYDGKGRSVANFRGAGLKVRVPSRGRVEARWNGRIGTWSRGKR
jgi:hypothetical protein